MTEDSAEITTLEEALREIEKLRRTVGRLTRDNRVLVRLRENAEHIRTIFEKEKKLQFLFNDLLLDHTPNMIFLFNEELEYIIGSRACKRLTRQKHVDLSHRPLPLLFCKEVDGLWVEKISRFNAEVLRTREAVRFHDTILIEGEPLLHAHITISPMLDDAGLCQGTIMAVNDVSELVAAQRRAEEAAKSKSAFLANMSHEIRTPMNAIKGLSELLALTPLNLTQRNYIKNIVGSANSLIGIINDVLDFSKIDANRIELLPAPYSLHKLIAEICGVIALRAEEKGLALFLDIDPTIPARLIGDDARIKQILVNMLSNAVKYTPSGSITLSIQGTKRDKFIDLAMSVEDTGVGVKDEDQHKLFSAFSRVDLLTNKRIQGTGLGLAISKALAEAMGGRITVHSVYGHGSTFTLLLPQEAEDPAPLANLEEPERVRVLLLGGNARMQNTARMLEQLGASYATLGESDVDLARLLGRTTIDLPPCGEPPLPYTHCIYSDAINEREMRRLKTILEECRFATLRSIINSMDEPGQRDTVLFNPLLITELAKFLNRSGRRTSARSIASDTSVAPRPQFRDVSALVVDDNRINLMVCEKMLHLYGVAVTTAPGGREGLALARENKYDILFVDHMMPEVDGIEVTEEIRSHDGPNKRTPIVALTANVVNDMRSFYIQAGMDDFVGKPIDRNELTRVLTQWLPPEKVIQTMGTNKHIG
ncbi:MAG: response regulator [Planctomycetaceae bacterium]|nr:response regulator [Planctomycetaceae bacterium]